MRRVAIPIVDGRLSEYFGQCSHYEIFEIRDAKVTSNKIEVPTVSNIKSLPDWAAQRGVTDIIAYKMDKRIISMFALHKIHLYVGVKKSTPQELISVYMSGRLQSNPQIINEITGAND